jgi:nitrate/nitrite transport system substrate-binding protein
MKDMGLPTPASTYKSFMVMGNTFDPGKPEEYVQSVAIKRV